MRFGWLLQLDRLDTLQSTKHRNKCMTGCAVNFAPTTFAAFVLPEAMFEENAGIDCRCRQVAGRHDIKLPCFRRL
jgi:hypothetical protein